LGTIGFGFGLLHALMLAVQEGRLRCSSFPEAMFDQVDRALDVAPPLTA